MKKNKVVITLLIIIIVLLVGLICFGGYKYMEMDKDYNKLNDEYNSIKDENQKVAEELNKIKEELDKQKEEEATKDNSDVTEAYLKILGNKQSYISKSGKNVYINDIIKNEPYSSEIQYAVLDMDNAGEKELVAYIGETVLILHYEDGKVYGFKESYRGFKNLKVNGQYEGSAGAANSYIAKSSFSKNSMTTTILASDNGNTYTVNDKQVSKDVWSKAIEEFSQLENVAFIAFK